MILSSLLDVIDKNVRKNKGHGKLAHSAAVKEFLELIQEAEKFDFGVIAKEVHASKKFGHSGLELPFFKMPEITDEELDFWLQGLLPLAHKIVWYEFTVRNHTSALLLKRDENNHVYCQRIEYYDNSNTRYMIDGTWARLTEEKNIQWQNANVDWTKALQSLPPDQAYDLWGSSVLLGVYLTLMINSKTTELRTVHPEPRQQSLRKQLKKTPLHSHTVVTIIPKRFIDEAVEADGEKVKGTHASPRIHWRRSHVRTYHRDTPRERKVVIARQIVGRRDLGTVTHDYVVRIKVE